MIICSECGTQLVDEAKFCHMCGKTVVHKEATCSKCGELLKEGARFCFSCGTPVNSPANSEPKTIVIKEAPSKPISPLICELCGSNNLIKEDGLFSCQHCGTRYTLEEARKLITGTVKIDNTEMIGNYLMMADNAFKAGNYNESETYANKAIEIDPQNVQAWFIKGNAAGWQSTGGNLRLNESLQCWSNVDKYSNDEDKAKYRGTIAIALEKLFRAIVSFKVDLFIHNPTKTNANAILSLADQISNDSSLKSKLQTSTKSQELCEFMAVNMQKAAVKANESHVSYYNGPGVQRIAANYPAWIETMDLYYLILDRAMKLSKDPETLVSICNNAIYMQKAVIGSCASAMNGKTWVVVKELSRSQKAERKDIIRQLEGKKHRLLY